MSLKKLLILCLTGGLFAACNEPTDLPVAPGGANAATAAVTSLASPNTWSIKAPMPLLRSYMGAAANAGLLYVPGGFTSGPTKSLQVYNLRTNTWSARKSLPLPKALSSAAFLGGKLYVAGGAGDRTLLVYNPATNSWSRKTDMPESVIYGVEVVINGQLYMCGSVLYRYDPGTNKWTKLATSPNAANAAAVGVIGGRIYVAGGQENGDRAAPTAAVYAYDPATNRWQPKATMPAAVTVFPASAVIDKKLYVAGGSMCSACTPDVGRLQVYDPVTDTWRNEAPMSTPRMAAAGATAGGKLYVLGGMTDFAGPTVTKVEVYTP